MSPPVPQFVHDRVEFIKFVVWPPEDEFHKSFAVPSLQGLNFVNITCKSNLAFKFTEYSNDPQKLDLET